MGFYLIKGSLITMLRFGECRWICFFRYGEGKDKFNNIHLHILLKLEPYRSKQVETPPPKKHKLVKNLLNYINFVSF